MQQIHLKGRLSLCAWLVRGGSRLADIGTDHAYLPIALCLSGRIPCALACDINPLPLASAREHIASFGLSDRIAARLSDGLEEVGADEADDIVIAGMGGELIASILDACPWTKDGDKRFILQPMTRHEALIRYLYANGFDILRQEAVLDEKKYYTVILAAYDGAARECDDLTAHIGRLTPDSEASVGFLTKCLNQLRKKSIGDPSLAPVADRIEELLS
jgi:tRNA (adenine22-N1)-methyltransferase